VPVDPRTLTRTAPPHVLYRANISLTGRKRASRTPAHGKLQMKKDSFAHFRSVGTRFFGLLFVLTLGCSQTAFAENPAAEEKPSAPVEKPLTFNLPEELSAPSAEVEPFELGLAYNYINVPDANDVKDLHGFDASLFFNLNRWLALGGDFIGGFGNNTSRDGSNLETVKLYRLVYMLGPQLTLRPKERFSIFGQASFGGAYDHTDVSVRGPAHFRASSSMSADAWAFDISVGADWRLTRHVSWRIIQAGYLGTHFSSPSDNDRQDNWRISTGVVWSFGGKERAVSAK
jgi:Outer membrane protein beta-barrel domain